MHDEITNAEYARRNLENLLKTVSMEEILEQRPNWCDIDKKYKTLALKIEGEEWCWCVSEYALGGSSFILHERR